LGLNVTKAARQQRKKDSNIFAAYGKEEFVYYEQYKKYFGNVFYIGQKL